MNHLRIGIDFDNTLVIYDDVFHRHATDMGYIDKSIPVRKQVVRDAIRALPEGENKWIELQALVYGLYISEAQPAAGVFVFLAKCNEHDAEISIVSHKTEYASRGVRHNLCDAARGWIKQHRIIEQYGIDPDMIFFLPTRKEKLDRVAQLQCTYFIDDLSEVLLDSNFPASVEAVLYSREKDVVLPENIVQLDSWEKISEHIFG